MNQKSLVSAIMIFLNDEPFIKDAIASIFTQTYNHWELDHIRLINPNKGGGAVKPPLVSSKRQTSQLSSPYSKPQGVNIKKLQRFLA